MADTNITFAKVVANPNTYAWSQAYNAGRLFSVISLETPEELEEKDYLNVLGKEILDTLEQEFFSLEEKNLDSIRNAVKTTSEKIPNDVSCSFVIAAFVENVLYLYILGGGKVAIKREGNLGNLLEAQNQDSKSLKEASGYLHNDDVIILQTRQFSNVVSAQSLSELLDNRKPADVSEHLAPIVHEKDEAGAASIIINYKGEEKEEEEVLSETKEKESLEENDKDLPKDNNGEKEEPSPFYSSSIEGKSSFRDRFNPLLSRVRVPSREGLSHPRKVILTIVIIILIVFTASVIFAVKKQQDSKNQAIFQNIYPQASKKYEEGQSLLGLNEGLAQDSFTEAKKLLEDGENKLPKGSSEEKQISSLLEKVNDALSKVPSPNVSSAKEVDASKDNLLLAETKNQGLYFAKDSGNIYFLTSGAVYSLNSDGTGKKSIITNDSDWTNPGGLSNYNGNVYILDKKQNQILKFVAGDSGYSKSNYFSDNANQEITSAVSMAIDSSIYVLSSNGNINKFTKGNSDTFSVTGLDKDFSAPTRILTSADDDYIYVLDNGNSRIVVLDKKGAYKSQYQATVIKSAKDFDVSETDKKTYVLSDGKVYEIELK